MSIYKLGKIGGSTPTPPETAIIGGKQYPVVTIGSKKWLGANLDYKFSGCNFNEDIFINTTYKLNGNSIRLIKD